MFDKEIIMDKGAEQLKKRAEEIKASELFQQYINEKMTPEEAALAVLDVITNGAFAAVEEPKRSEFVQKAVHKWMGEKAASSIKKIKISKKEWDSLSKTADFTPFSPATYKYYINLDERGSFYADVRNENGKTIFKIKAGNELGPDESSIFEDGWMKHKNDLVGLKNYLVHLGIMKPNQNLVKGQ